MLDGSRLTHRILARLNLKPDPCAFLSPHAAAGYAKELPHGPPALNKEPYSRMLYSPERNSLAGSAPTGSVLPCKNARAGGYSSRHLTFFGAKDADERSMSR